MGKNKERVSTGEKVENLMEFLNEGKHSESDSEYDRFSRRGKRKSSGKITPESDPEIQGISDEIFGDFPNVEETAMEDENDEMEKSKSSSSSHRSSSSPKVEKIKKIRKGNISSEGNQMNDGARITGNPSSRSDSFVENVDGFAIFPNSRRKGDASMPKGKDVKPKSPAIRKKARKGSDDEVDHGEGDGESEKESPKEHQEPSIDGNSVNQASQQGEINAKDENNKTEVGGSSTGKSKIISPKRLSGTNTRSASGFLGRRA